MQIERLKLKNFKAFRDVDLGGIQPYSVFVGPNGVGKSTLFDVFGFLRDCLRDNVRVALARRGGFREVVSRGHEKEAITIELKVRFPLAGSKRVMTYLLSIGLDSAGNPIVARESLKYRRGSTGQPFAFLDFKNGSGQAITNEDELIETDLPEKREEQRLDTPDILAIKGLGQFQRFKAVSAFRSLIENWHVSDFQIKAARSVPDAGHAEHLSSDGENLPLVAKYLFENHRDVFNRILKAIANRVPGIAGVQAENTVDGRVVLRFLDGSFKDPFISRYVSDGTIKMFAYLILLYDPSPHPLMCVEEPENQLYPSLLDELSEEFDNYAARGEGQVFVSTHSPDFLNAVPLKSIFVLEKDSGFTKVRRAVDDENVVSLHKAGDLPGALWRQGILARDEKLR